MPIAMRPETEAFPDQVSRSPTARYAAPFLSAIALIYALLAALHTLQDFDLGLAVSHGPLDPPTSPPLLDGCLLLHR